MRCAGWRGTTGRVVSSTNLWARLTTLRTQRSRDIEAFTSSYRYRNLRVPAYDGLRVELQLRSRHQHTWATAVETMGTFLGQALKSSEGEAEWLDFFSLAGAAFAHLEGTPPVPGYSELSKLEAYDAADAEATRLRIREQLSAFTVAMDAISSDHRPGSYRLVVLDLDKRQVSIATFTREALT